MRRRSFLNRVGSWFALLATASLPYGMLRLLAPEPEAASLSGSKFGRLRGLLRPPGAIADEASFIANCIGCGACGEVCPVRCIRFHSRAGGAATNTPYIDPLQRACILCGKCMDICPTPALSPTARRDIDMGIAQIDRDACYPWVDHGVCGACATVCPLGESAIGFAFANMYRPVVKTGCVGCGLCVEVCPHPSVPIRVVARDSNRSRPSRPDIAHAA